jgi:hypothetical protein
MPKSILDRLLEWNTQEDVAEMVGISQQGIDKILKKFTTDSQMRKSSKDFSPLLYSIWNTHLQFKPPQKITSNPAIDISRHNTEVEFNSNFY